MQKRNQLIVKRDAIVLSALYFLMLIMVFIYFQINTLQYFKGNLINLSAINWHDHEVYLQYITFVRDSEWDLSINNNTGISFIYNSFYKIFPDHFFDENFATLSLLVNSIVLFFIYYLYNKICNRLNLPSFCKYFLFFYFPLIYFCQLINKDIFTLLIFLIVLNLSISYAKYKAASLIFLMIPLFMLVRLQLGFFAIIFLFFLISKKYKLLFIVLYMITSFLGAWLSVNGGYIEVETFGEGMTAFLRSWNASYFYTGFVIFNPIRVVQYFQAMYLSFFVINEGQFDWARFLNIPSVIILSLYWKHIFKAFLNIKYTYNTELKPIMILVLSFMLTWLMNPTVNTRYVMLVVPFLFILGVAFKYRKKEI